MRFLKTRNNSVLFNLAILCVLVFVFLLFKGVSKGEIQNGWGFWLLSLPFQLIVILAALFVAFFIYLLILKGGFRIFHITEIPQPKIIPFILVMLFINFFSNSILPDLLGKVVNEYSIYFFRIPISFGVLFSLLKYYFLLSGKKLWQLLLYFFVIDLLLSLLLSWFFLV